MDEKIDLFLEKYMDKELKETGDINSKYINYISDYAKYKNIKIEKEKINDKNEDELIKFNQLYSNIENNYKSSSHLLLSVFNAKIEKYNKNLNTLIANFTEINDHIYNEEKPIKETKCMKNLEEKIRKVIKFINLYYDRFKISVYSEEIKYMYDNYKILSAFINYYIELKKKLCIEYFEKLNISDDENELLSFIGSIDELF